MAGITHAGERIAKKVAICKTRQIAAAQTNSAMPSLYVALRIFVSAFNLELFRIAVTHKRLYSQPGATGFTLLLA